MKKESTQKNGKYKLVMFSNKDIIEIRKRSFYELVFIFTLCSILGYFVETGYVFLDTGNLVKRGMLLGPYCPIYGFGASILYLLFYNIKPTKKNIPYIFFLSALTMGGFELLSGLGFKYILNIEMWNYHGKFLEILNYTTVPILIGWGILGTIYVFAIQPFLSKILDKIPLTIKKRLTYIIITIYLFDFAISVFRIMRYPDILYKLVHP